MRNKTFRFIAPLAAAFALAAPRAAHATDWCGQLPSLWSTVQSKVIVARDRAAAENTAHPGVYGVQTALSDLNYILSTVMPPYQTYVDGAAAHGTPGGSAWGYQAHWAVVAPQAIDAELNDAESQLMIAVYQNGSSFVDAFNGVLAVVDAHNAATAFDLATMRCYMSPFFP